MMAEGVVQTMYIPFGLAGSLLSYPVRRCVVRLELRYAPTTLKRCREYVFARYPEPVVGAAVWSPPVTAFGGDLARELNNALYIRLHLRHVGWLLPAENCEVVLRGIRHDGKLIDDEMSPLFWTDRDSSAPLNLSAKIGEAYVDVCAVYRECEGLYILSQKGRKNYGKLTGLGEYTLDICAVTAGVVRKSIRLAVVRGESGWDDLQVTCC